MKGNNRMYRWYIKIFLQNGNIIEGMYESGIDKSESIFKILFSVSHIPSGSRCFRTIYNLDKTSEILFNAFDVSAVEISEL
jgi:hypothetical protein